MAEIEIGESQNGQAIPVKNSDVLLIRLPENPTTGFRWNVKEADPNLLKLQSDDFSPATAGGVGAGGVRLFRFVAVGSGEAALALDLARAWEPATPRSQFRLRVNVR
jgi:inhibitor of cysteine peptidase